MDHPFHKTSDTDLQIKLRNGTIIYLDTNILRNATNGDFLASCSSVTSVEDFIKFASKEAVFEVPDSTSNTLDLTAYNAYDVIEFFKHFYPQQNAQFTDYTNFKTMLDLCCKFKTNWLKVKIHKYLADTNFTDTTVTKLALYFSLAQEFNLQPLKTKLEDSLILKFQRSHISEKSDIFHIVAQFDLVRVHKTFEESMMRKIKQNLPEPRRRRPRRRRSVFDDESESDDDTLYGRAQSKKCFLTYLLIAEYYHYDRLKAILLSGQYLIVNSWMEDKRMANLSQRILFEIANSIISNCSFGNHKVGTVLNKILKNIYSDLCSSREEAILTQHVNSLEMTVAAESSGDREELKNPFIASDTSDVEVTVGKTTLHLHSSILRYGSPVFKVMLSSSFTEGRTKKISLPNKDVATVIEFFEFFYIRQNKNLTDSSNFVALLYLCQEYQVDWLVGKIEDFMVDSFDFERNIKHALVGWQCLERFPQLHKLKAKVDESKPYQDLEKLESSRGFLSLTHVTKYKIVRKFMLFQQPLDERMLKFLDEIFLYRRVGGC